MSEIHYRPSRDDEFCDRCAIRLDPAPAFDVTNQGAKATCKRTDTAVIDEIARMMGDRPEWSSEMLEWIADSIGLVRPHPGGFMNPGEYSEALDAWKAEQK